jgi:hypothetical protein
MTYLAEFTFFINYSAFILVLWLGLYLVMHNPRYSLSWLTALTLWSLATLFLHYLLEPTFWLNRDFAYSSNPWFQGLAVAPALAFWHHATMLTRPRRLNPWRLIRILTAYLVAGAAVIVQATTRVWSRAPRGDLLYLNSRLAGPLYPFFGAALLLFIAASMINLIRSARASRAELPRKQLVTLAWATLVAGFTGPAMLVGMLLRWPVPSAVISILLAISVGLIGFGVARYSAMMQGRTIHRDFFYTLFQVGIVSLVYIPVCWFLLEVYKAPPITVILVPVLAVFTHSLVNPAYRLFDRLVLSRESRQLRSELRQLSHLAFESDSFIPNLIKTLETLCNSVNASYGIVITFEADHLKVIASYNWKSDLSQIELSCLLCDDVVHLSPGQLPSPLQDVALLLPFYGEKDQFGALALGNPVNGPRYADEDIDRILNPAELIGEAILRNSQQRVWMEEIAHIKNRPISGEMVQAPLDVVENGLRNLDDYACLADSPLAELGLVQFRLPGKLVTHLDRGKIVHEVLLEAINKLCPGTESKRDPPPREWYPYLILKDAYIEGISNRDIMLDLYISEGTFNRIRRAAIRSVARTLEEMENNLQ